jgi:predicted component of type VI protein secretion system
MRSRDGDAAALPALWAELQRHLDRRVAALNDEVSHYPTPIARCDEQLAALLEQRAALFARLQRMDELAAAIRTIETFLDAPADCADEQETALRARLREQLSRLAPA